MITSIIIIIAIVLLTYKQRTINNQLHNEITTNSNCIEELESFTYHDESEIKDWIEDGTRDIQYDLDNHSSEIEDLSYDKANNNYVDGEIEDLHKKLTKIIKEEMEEWSVLFDRVRNITAYLSSTTSDFQKTLNDSGNPIAYDKDNNAEKAVRILQLCKDAINNNFPDDEVGDISITFNGDEYSLATNEIEGAEDNE
tara:strand:+ start:15571 stop:16161 length:591 start_codon:yes stop_codon:yes gene_type:complete